MNVEEPLFSILSYLAFSFVLFFAPTPLTLFWGVAGFLRLPPFLFSCFLVVYCATVVFSPFTARRLHFAEYDTLRLVKDPRSAFFGCLLAWHVCFPVFLYNCHRVMRKTLSSGQVDGPKRANKELHWLLTLQALAIWLAMAVPSCLSNPARANEASAVSALRSYADAQETFIRTTLTTGDSGYCDNYRNLYYGTEKGGEPLRLLSQAMADAFGVPPSGAPTSKEAQEKATPYQNYLFIDDPYITENKLWDSEFGLFAVPARPDRDMFWIGKNRGVLRKPFSATGGKTPTIRPEDSPLNPDSRNNWETP